MAGLRVPITVTVLSHTCTGTWTTLPDPTPGAALLAPHRVVTEPRVPERRAADVTDDALEAVEKSVDSPVQSITSGSDGIDQVLSSVTDLLTDEIDFTTTLTDGELSTATPSATPAQPGTAASTSVPEVPAVTLPAITLPASVPLSAS
jgi:hypothetical protein